jgi:hypothetical protein
MRNLLQGIGCKILGIDRQVQTLKDRQAGVHRQNFFFLGYLILPYGLSPDCTGLTQAMENNLLFLKLTGCCIGN